MVAAGKNRNGPIELVSFLKGRIALLQMAFNEIAENGELSSSQEPGCACLRRVVDQVWAWAPRLEDSSRVFRLAALCFCGCSFNCFVFPRKSERGEVSISGCRTISRLVPGIMVSNFEHGFQVSEMQVCLEGQETSLPAFPFAS